MLQLHHKPGALPPLPESVISEIYEEIEFHHPSPDLSDALLAHPLEKLPKPNPNPRYSTFLINVSFY